MKTWKVSLLAGLTLSLCACETDAKIGAVQASRSDRSGDDSRHGEDHHRGGRDDQRSDHDDDFSGGRGTDFTEGSAAWFLVESLEHSLRPQQPGLSSIVSGESLLRNATSSDVRAEEQSGSLFQDSCTMIDELSRRGTVLKKDVRCSVAPTVRGSLIPGSNAWLIVESIEHSLRSERLVNAAIENSIVRTSGLLQSANTIRVELAQVSGEVHVYQCSAQGTRSVSCQK